MTGGWTQVPVDEAGYFDSSVLARLPASALKAVIAEMHEARFSGWRNHGGLWRDLMGLDLGGRTVLDFGCGAGLEALELCRAGNQVIITDIIPANLRLAERVLRVHGYAPAGVMLYPDAWPVQQLGTFHASGVLHHIRHPVPVMTRAHGSLQPGGEARLMLYSDIGWRIATGTEPPEDVTSHPSFPRFVRFFDDVGDYADWYDQDRLEGRFGHLFTVERCEYMAPDRRYLGAVLRRKP